MTGGRGLDTFREENIKDTHYRAIYDYPNDKDIFPDNDIGGGIGIYLWDRKHNGEVKYHTYKGNECFITEPLFRHRR